MRDKPDTGPRWAKRAGVILAVLGTAWAAQAALEVPDQLPRDTRSTRGVPDDSQVMELLTGIDYVPTRAALDQVLGQSAPVQLVAIALGVDPELDDPGIRIRAYRALALYPGETAARALASAIGEHRQATRGRDTLYVRAAMDSLARIGAPDAVRLITPLLDHANRDVRAAAAAALAATGSVDAIPALRARLPVEAVLQVRLAIADALRQLGDG